MKSARGIAFSRTILFFLVGIVSCIGLYNWYGMNKNQPKKTVIIGLAGDVMLGRLVNEKLKKVPFAYSWGNVLPLLLQPDITIINLETTLTESQRAVPKVFNFRSDPKNIQVLKVANIKVVSLANNHIKDFDDEGLRDTITTLDNEDILHVGAGGNKLEARKSVILTRQGIKIGILGATDNEAGWTATDTSPGINYFHVERPEELLEDIKKLKKHVDIVIISLHWGPNMREHPTEQYIKAAHAMIDAGADIIHGHSAHIFQGIEVYSNKLILYDTGNFVDDYRVDAHLRNDRSFFFVVEVSKGGVQSLQLIPVLIDSMQVNVARGQDYDWSMTRIRKLSKEFGTIISLKGLWNRAEPLINV